MADLYTSLVRAKQELNGGIVPAMTPVPERLHEIIDPAFTIGMGALREDPEKGLQCPVRGCGQWRQELSRHISTAHADVGGCAAVKRLLSIPESVGLVSRRRSAERASKITDQAASGKMNKGQFGPSRPPAEIVRSYRRRNPQHGKSVGVRNLRNTCEAQIAQRLWSARDKLGRSPSAKELEAMGERSLVRSCMSLYGTFDAAKAAAGLTARKAGSPPKHDMDSVLAALREWYDLHGSLPRRTDAKCPTRTPLIPSERPTIRALQATSWPDAMRIAASMLNIHGGRYGLPERKAAA